MLIQDSDQPAIWYHRVKKAWAESVENGTPVREPGAGAGAAVEELNKSGSNKWMDFLLLMILSLSVFPLTFWAHSTVRSHLMAKCPSFTFLSGETYGEWEGLATGCCRHRDDTSTSLTHFRIWTAWAAFDRQLVGSSFSFKADVR